MTEVVIRTVGLCKTFSSGGIQQHVLNQLNLSIYQGDLTVIMGSSGSGKSTLLYALSGMDKPSLGEITFAGQRIDGLDNDKLAIFRRKNCGFVFQDVFLNEDMSIMDNVLAAAYLMGGNRKESVKRAAELLEHMGLEAEMHRKFPAQMSGGELQRVGLVRAVINDPKVIFADEPTGALNSANSEIVLDLMNRLNDEGKSIVLVTHDLRTAARGNRILYLKDGAILAEKNLGKYVKENEKERLEELKTFLDEMGW